MGKFDKFVLKAVLWTASGFVAFFVGFALGNTTQALSEAITRA